jgi:hypothetical protein
MVADTGIVGYAPSPPLVPKSALLKNEENIYIKNNKKIQKVKIKNIEKIELEIPQYTGIPGSGYSYNYTFKVLDNNSKLILLNIVLERNEEKEIIEFLKNKNILLEIKYYDNRNDGTD